MPPSEDGTPCSRWGLPRTRRPQSRGPGSRTRACALWEAPCAAPGGPDRWSLGRSPQRALDLVEVLFPMQRPIQETRPVHRADLAERCSGEVLDEAIDRRSRARREVGSRGDRCGPPLRQPARVYQLGQGVASELHRLPVARELLEPSRAERVPECEMREETCRSPAARQLDAPATDTRDHRRQPIARRAIARAHIARHFRSDSRKVLSVATLSAVAASASMTTNALSWA